MEEIKQIEEEIGKIKKELLKIGDMRSGSLTRQYQDRKNKKGGYWSLSYTSKMRSHTECVRPVHLKETGRQIAQYKKFRKLMTRWIDLARELCRLRLNLKANMSKQKSKL